MMKEVNGNRNGGKQGIGCDMNIIMCRLFDNDTDSSTKTRNLVP